MNAQRWMSRQFFLFFISWGVFLPYWTGWLVAAKQLTIAEASFIMSVGLMARGVSTLFVFPAISRIWDAKKVIVMYAIAALFFALCYVPIEGFFGLLIVTICFSFTYPSLMPALESAAGLLVQYSGLHYGRARSYGSIGFTLMVLLLTVVVGVTSDGAILWLIIGAIAIFCVSLTLAAPAIVQEKPERNEHSRGTFKALFTSWKFPLVLSIVICIQGAHATYYNNGYLYLQHLEVPAYYIGIIINIAVIFEIGILLVADKWFGHWHPVKLLCIAAVGATLRWTVIYMFPSIWVFIVSQAFHALSFALAHYAFILYISKSLSKSQIPNAQGLYSAFALSWSTAVLTILAGRLYEIEPRQAFLAMSFFTALAVIGCIIYLGKEKQSNKAMS